MQEQLPRGYHARPMSLADLERRLRAARDCDAWIAALAEFFTAHGLFVRSRHRQRSRRGLLAVAPSAGLARRRFPERRRRPSSCRRRSRSPRGASRSASRSPISSTKRGSRACGSSSTSACSCRARRSPRSSSAGSRRGARLRPATACSTSAPGSGCIAIAAAHYCPEVAGRRDGHLGRGARGRGAERRAARHRRARSLVRGRFVSAGGARAIASSSSNPPYVPESEVATLAARVPPRARARPRERPDRLRRGGAHLARRRSSGSTPDGVLFLELGAGAEAFAAAHPRLPLIALEFERGGDGVLVTTAARDPGIPSHELSAHHWHTHAAAQRASRARFGRSTWQAIRTDDCSRSRPSARAMGPRWAASSTAVRRASL